MYDHSKMKGLQVIQYCGRSYLAAGGEGLLFESSALQLLPSAGAQPASLCSSSCPQAASSLPWSPPLPPLLLALCSLSSGLLGGAGVRKLSLFSLGGTAGGMSLGPENNFQVDLNPYFSHMTKSPRTRHRGGVPCGPCSQRESVQDRVLGAGPWPKNSGQPAALLWTTCQRTVVSFTQ